MTNRVVRSSHAKQDLTNYFAYIAHDNLDAAVRFLRAYEKAAEQVSNFPEIGSQRILRGGKVRDIRLWPLDGFEKYMLVYQIRKNSILILRVMHAAQDYTQL